MAAVTATAGLRSCATPNAIRRKLFVDVSPLGKPIAGFPRSADHTSITHLQLNTHLAINKCMFAMADLRLAQWFS